MTEPNSDASMFGDIGSNPNNTKSALFEVEALMGEGVKNNEV